MRLKDKIAIITGVASGQGRAAAVIFAREGAKIVGCDWNNEAGEETTRLVRETAGEMTFLKADVSSAKDCENVARTASQRHGRIDGLYNHAGAGLSSPLSTGHLQHA